ncbi:MAG: thiamine phosphate synthase [Pseudomonadota bacterium]
MVETERPQPYLITPPEFDLTRFPGELARVLDGVDVACVRLSLSTRNANLIARSADALREICHARDIALVIESHIRMVACLGLDGVHLTHGGRNLRRLRKDMGQEAIIGVFCGTSRHDGISAGEAGIDYVAFGPAGQTPLGDDARAGPELFAWWSEMIEMPVVAEGALTLETIRALAPVSDFFGIGEEIWSKDDPLAALREMTTAMV